MQRTAGCDVVEAPGFSPAKNGRFQKWLQPRWTGAKALSCRYAFSARVNRPPKKSKQQIPRGLKAARDDKK
jgi:hypothetical protein